MRATRKSSARPAREIAEETVHLLRAAPVAAWGAYFLGTIPFCVGMIYFVNAMEVYAFAERGLPLYAALLTLLFVWMKAWQARFAEHLLCVLRGEGVRPWPLKAFLATVYNQAVLQTTGLFLLPFAFLSMILYVPAYGFYQNVTALDAAGTRGTRDLFTLAQQEAFRWQRQAYVLQWLLSPAFVLMLGTSMWFVPVLAASFGFAPSLLVAIALGAVAPLLLPFSPLALAIVVNLAAGAFAIAGLLKSFLDIDSIFVWAQFAAMNRAFIMTLLAVCYLVMDPLIKTAYVLRCYYGQSLRTGEDLRGTLRRIQRATQTTLVIAFMALAAQAVHADAAAPNQDPAAIREAVQTELSDPVYTWRMERPESAAPGKENFLTDLWHRFTQWLKDTVRAFFRWLYAILHRLFPEDREQSSGAGSETLKLAMEVAIVVLVVVLVAIVFIVAVRQWRLFAQAPDVQQVAVAQPEVKIEDESARADALPEDQWLQLAREYQAQGDYRLAMRALFLAMLASLAARNLIQIVRYKSNLAYKAELKRRTQPETFAAFTEGVLQYECVWYGDHPATPERFAQLFDMQEKVRAR